MKEIVLSAGVALILGFAFWQTYLGHMQKKALARRKYADADGVYFFTSPSCRICSQMKQTYMDWIKKEAIQVVDITEQSSLAQQYGIRSVPTTVVIRQGRAFKVFLGYVKPAELRPWLSLDEGDKS